MSTARLSSTNTHPHREILAFTLYRVLMALLMLTLVSSPLFSQADQDNRAALTIIVCAAYLLSTLLLVWQSRAGTIDPRRFFYHCLGDIAVTGMAMHATHGVGTALAMSLMINLTALASVLDRRSTIVMTALASAMLVAEQAWRSHEGMATSPYVETALLITCYAALAWIGNLQSERGRISVQLAEKRSAEIANLYEINTMILRRMRTGVLVVDREEHITLANESAIALLGTAPTADTPLQALSSSLSSRLRRWRDGWPHEQSPVELPGSGVEVQPRFVSLMADSELALVFLDDTSIASRRAESLTLSTIGRFAASLAHEIRNPLTAISYASQLLGESKQLDDQEKRLAQIIHQQCLRTNSIVDAVLGMARRERANPENVELVLFLPRFVEEFRQSMASADDTLEFIHTAASVTAVVDPRHLHQVLTILVHNALRHGRRAGQTATVQLRLSAQHHRATIDCIDHGPGLQPDQRDQVFKPFYTTDENGTGLGLYLARELCIANQGQLTHVEQTHSGACFRIALPMPSRA